MSEPADHSRRARRALRKLAEEDPAFAALALWCNHRDGDTQPVRACSSGSTITYGAGFEDLALHEQIGLCAHHILHIAFRHSARATACAERFGTAFDAELFNLAADAIASSTVSAAGYALPRPAVLLPELLARAFGTTVADEQALGAWDVERLYVALRHTGRGAGMDDAPSATRSHSETGKPDERARTYGAERDFDEDLSADGDGAQADQEDHDWRARLSKALQAGRQAGRGLGLLGHRLGDIPQSRTPWEQHLRQLVSRAVMPAPERNPMRPSGRWLAGDAVARCAGGPTPFYEPGLRRLRQAPRLAVALDMSGSIADRMLATFAGEIDGISRRSGAEIHMILFDEAVRHQTKLAPGSLRSHLQHIPFAREGGTDLAAPLAAAVALDPALAIVLTDLEGPTGPRPRDLQVLWAIPDTQPARTPGFGRILSLAR